MFLSKVQKNQDCVLSKAEPSHIVFVMLTFTWEQLHVSLRCWFFFSLLCLHFFLKLTDSLHHSIAKYVNVSFCTFKVRVIFHVALRHFPSRVHLPFMFSCSPPNPFNCKASEVAKAMFFSYWLKNLREHLPDSKDVHGLRPSEARLGGVCGWGWGGRLGGGMVYRLWVLNLPWLVKLCVVMMMMMVVVWLWGGGLSVVQ